MASRMTVEPHSRPEPGQILIVIRKWFSLGGRECAIDESYARLPGICALYFYQGPY
jgi:hypothetical protein